MLPDLTRRAAAATTAVVLAGLVACAGPVPGGPSPAPAPPSTSVAPDDPSPGAPPSAPAERALDLRELEAQFGARVGVHVVDTGTGATVTWRADERFAYASTIKALAAGAVLDLVGVAGLEQQVRVETAALVPSSPVTEAHVGGTLSLREVAEAAVTRSDNTAGNLLLEVLGGPAGLDAALTALGDDVTVVSRVEPDLNEAVPGDDRDTTTPRALAGDLRAYVLGDVLDEAERGVLRDWLVGSQTGATLVRAGLPAGWVVGDKSGTGGYGTRNDVAVAWPPGGSPVVVAVMSDRGVPDAERGRPARRRGRGPGGAGADRGLTRRRRPPAARRPPPARCATPPAGPATRCAGRGAWSRRRRA
ncbi:class A beta-lactamase [Actinotalea solisilvae]|uniref:class A beta-lactamase n=1 Tax=Actinotalea solisilvae TaxID=2072922 RepID=UPI0027DCC58B|nr:class A beta-lactamase [Actinotalea solisilvae]